MPPKKSTTASSAEPKEKKQTKRRTAATATSASSEATSASNGLIEFMGGTSVPIHTPAPEVKMTIVPEPSTKTTKRGKSAITSHSATDDDSVVIHLPLDIKKLESEEIPEYLRYNPDIPNIPEPWSPENNYEEIDTTEYEESKDDMEENITTISSTSLATGTAHYCMWDGQPFYGQVYSIPMKIEKGNYKTYGTFSSPEASAAYLFTQKISDNTLWDRYYLLNDMISVATGKIGIKIKPAPPKESLKIYGGIFDLNEYRDIATNYRKHVVVNMPPMVPVLMAIAVTNNCFNTEVTTKVAEDIKNGTVSKEPKLKREKKIYHGKNTIESCMNVEFK